MIEDFAGIKHRFREGGDFRTVQASNRNGHEPCSHLIIRDFATRVSADEKADLLAGQFPGITFLADQVNGAHACGRRTGSVAFAVRGVNAWRGPSLGQVTDRVCQSTARYILGAEIRLVSVSAMRTE